MVESYDGEGNVPVDLSSLIGGAGFGTGTEDFVEVECDLAELLNHYKFHPLNYFLVQEINLLGKTDEFHLYSFFSAELE